MEMYVKATGMTIDVPDERTARLYETSGFAVPVVPEVEKPAPRKRAQRKTKTE